MKRSALTDGRGVPLGIAIAGANVHDRKLVRDAFESVPVRRPRPTPHRRQHLRADKGDDAKAIRPTARRRGHLVQIPRKGEDTQHRHRHQGRARRWVVERHHWWTNRARRLLIRWEKKPENQLGFIHLRVRTRREENRWRSRIGSFTVFALRDSRKAEVLDEILCDRFDGVIGCDRGKMYWRYGHPQRCWAHVKRGPKCSTRQSLIDQPGDAAGQHQAKRLGHSLIRATCKLFEQWRTCRWTTRC